MALTSGIFSLQREIKLTEDEFRRLAEFVYELLGIHIPDKRRYLLENRLADRLRDLSMKSFSDYLQYLRYDTGRSGEIDRLIERVTTNETSFFRDMSQLELFQETLLPRVVAARLKAGTRRLRIWSAGCSTGEEPYTLAMIVLRKLGAAVSQWDIRITGSDISGMVLEKARKGAYSGYSLRSTPEEVQKSFFLEENGRQVVHPTIKKMVEFKRINLTRAADVRSKEPWDIIFCRNVIIYFDENMKRRVADGFKANLAPDGYLVLGHSESLRNVTRAFLPMPEVGSPIYMHAEQTGLGR